MPLQTSGQISYGDAREEGNKSSWISPNYPNAGRQYDIHANWIINVDESNTIGYNTDGSFPITKIYGWDTWNRPTISELEVYQYSKNAMPTATTGVYDQGVRLYWKATGGDPYRTAYLIVRHTSDVSASNAFTNGTHVAIMRYGPEWANDRRVDRMTVRLGLNPIALYGDTGIAKYDLSQWGNHDTAVSQTQRYPDSTLVAAPTTDIGTDAASTEDVHFSFVDELNTSQVVSGPYYYYVFAMDGREFHELGKTRSDNVFDKSNNPTTAGSYNRASGVRAPVRAVSSHDHAVGDYGLKIFSSYGGLNHTDPVYGNGVVETTISPNNLFSFFLNGASATFYFYVQRVGTDPTPDINSTVDNTLDAGGFGQWYPTQNFPKSIDYLQTDTEHDIYVAIDGDYSTGNAPTSVKWLEGAPVNITASETQEPATTIVHSDWPKPTIQFDQIKDPAKVHVTVDSSSNYGVDDPTHVVISYQDDGYQDKSQTISLGSTLPSTVTMDVAIGSGATQATINTYSYSKDGNETNKSETRTETYQII